MMINFSDFSSIELIQFYGDVIKEMRERKIIYSKNVIGDIGEFTAINFYNSTKGLPKLQFAPPTTKNIDAISVKGERYSIKCTTSNNTGVFYGIDKDASFEKTKALFEYAIIVQLNEMYQTNLIIEVDWSTFFKHKHWHSRMLAHHLIISKSLLNDSRILYKSN